MDLTDSQNLVVKSKDKSMLVSASAGSGKTFVVVSRIIESIKNGTDISNLLILTFTNAAASELKERIVNKLYEYEDKLRLYEKEEQLKKIISKIDDKKIKEELEGLLWMINYR